MSTTSLTADTNGTLFALNASDGSILWSMHAVDPVSEVSYGLVYVPALDVTYV